ncbi:uncharacterized protein C15orf39 homolog isoform X1 [Lepisosteus oculatus]|uniref:uncharacterized protein C15orf39 homolog isoform X1 n=1 Tax=Lepisosteus oculatus TaxID=7918 RepID=UPI003716F594
MMSSKRTLSYMDPVVHSKVPRLEKTIDHIVSAGLGKPGTLPRYSLEDPLNYSGSYFTYCLTGQEGRDLPPPWNPSGTCMPKVRNPVVHPLNAERTLPNGFMYRSEEIGFPTENNPAVVQDLIAAKEKCAYFGKSHENSKHSPNTQGIHTPVAIRKLAVGSATVSSQSESSVGLAIPKPIYGQSPCCTDHGYKSRACYNLERGTDSVQHGSFEEEWKPVSGLRYGPMSPMDKREELIQQRVLQFEQNASRRFQPKEANSEGFHAIRPSEAIRLPSFIDADYNSLPYNGAARSFSSPSSQRFHSVQIPSKMYHGIPTSPSRNYNEVQQIPLSHSQISPAVYQERSSISRYPQLPQRHVFFYPQGSLDIEKGTTFKGMGEHLEQTSPTLNKSTQNPTEQYLVPQPYYTEVPIPYPMISTNVPFHRDYELAPYPVYKIQPSSGRKRVFSEVSGAPLQMQLSDRPMDFSSEKVRIMSPPREFNRQQHTSGAFHPVHARTVILNQENMPLAKQKMVVNSRIVSSPQEGIPFCVTGYPHEMTVPAARQNISGLAEHEVSDGSNYKLKDPKDSEERNTLMSPPCREPEGGEDVYEVVVSNNQERKKMDKLHLPPSPPMPVINNVFSLAPYKAYLEASGMLPLPDIVKSGSHSSADAHKPEQRMQEKVTRTLSKKDLEERETMEHVSTEQSNLQGKNGSLKISENRSDKLHDIQDKMVKKEEAEAVTSASDCPHSNTVLDLRVKKPGESGSQVQSLTENQNLPVTDSSTTERNGVLGESAVTGNIGASRAVSVSNFTQKKFQIIASPPPNPETLSHKPSESKISCFKQISAHCLKLPTFKIILPDVIKNTTQSAAEIPSAPSASPETKSNSETTRHARHHFMELHQSLCRLIASSISETSEEELKAWLAKTEENSESVSPSTKTQNISCIMGAIGREVWLKFEDIAGALRRVLSQLEDYISRKQCPFPHVIRTGTIFIPMVVVKESLFPNVPGSSIDQVLQEHRVELRPTTLSEERLLTQLQKRGCSSKLRRLLSLKQLPDIYPDVLNLYYHSCVRKHLDSTSPAGLQNSVQMTCCSMSVLNSCQNVFEMWGLNWYYKNKALIGKEVDAIVKTEKEEYLGDSFQPPSRTCSPEGFRNSQAPETVGDLKDLRRGTHFKKQRRKGRRKSALKRTFWGKARLGQGGSMKFTGNSESSSGEDSVCQDWERVESSFSGDSEKLEVKVEDVSSKIMEIKEEPENTSIWGPVTSDDFSSGNSDGETEKAMVHLDKRKSSLPRELTSKEVVSSGTPKKQVSVFQKYHSGVLLKFKRDTRGRDANFCPKSDPEIHVHYNKLKGLAGKVEEGEKNISGRVRPRVSQQRRRVPGIVEALRPTRSTSKVLHLRNSMVQIKFRRYLTVQHSVLHHSAQRRRKKVVRSAVQRVRQAMKTKYPELVGKRIRHLYEENDKSEVWYRGVVVRVYEPHPNPLKTVYEVKYDSEPEWQYYLELLMDYKKGWLKVED